METNFDYHILKTYHLFYLLKISKKASSHFFLNALCFTYSKTLFKTMKIKNNKYRNYQVKTKSAHKNFY